MIDALLSLPIPALILILAAFYSASALMLIRLSFGATVGPWVRSFRGVVGPFFGAIVIIFSILVGFLASDVWDRNRRAAATVRGEAANLVSLHALAAAHPGRTWWLSPSIPDDLAPELFSGPGWEKQGLEQWEMRLEI